MLLTWYRCPLSLSIHSSFCILHSLVCHEPEHKKGNLTVITDMRMSTDKKRLNLSENVSFPLLLYKEYQSKKAGNPATAGTYSCLWLTSSHGMPSPGWHTCKWPSVPPSGILNFPPSSIAFQPRQAISVSVFTMLFKHTNNTAGDV